MLRAPPNLDVFRHEIRRRVCARCSWRLPHSESLGPEVVRPCERNCPVFVHLARLRRRAALTDPMLRPRGDVLDHLINEICAVRSRGARACGAHPATPPATGACPLSSHRQQVARTILDLVGRT